MKRLMILFVLMVVCATNAWAMAKKPNPNTFNGCNDRARTECSFDKAKYSQYWMDPQWFQCANLIFDKCRCQYRPDLVKYNKTACA